MTDVLDLLGRPYRPGDLVVHAYRVGAAAHLNLELVTEVSPGRVWVTALAVDADRVLRRPRRASQWLRVPERCLVLGPVQVAASRLQLEAEGVDRAL